MAHCVSCVGWPSFTLYAKQSGYYVHGFITLCGSYPAMYGALTGHQDRNVLDATESFNSRILKLIHTRNSYKKRMRYYCWTTQLITHLKGSIDTFGLAGCKRSQKPSLPIKHFTAEQIFCIKAWVAIWKSFIGRWLNPTRRLQRLVNLFTAVTGPLSPSCCRQRWYQDAWFTGKHRILGSAIKWITARQFSLRDSPGIC